MQSQEDFTAEERASDSPPFAVVEDWQQTAEARGYVNSLLKRNKRRTFGFLEKPLLSLHEELPTIHRRLLLVGKAGVGKSSTVDKLCGRAIPAHHHETLGIQTNTVYWPAKLVRHRRVILVQLELWDTGGRAVKKFDHILPAGRQATDGIVFFFSYTDRHSWEELPQLISQTVEPDSTMLKLVVGTHFDSPHRDVLESEVKQFQTESRLIILPISNVNGLRLSDGKALDGRAGIADIAPFMNAVAEILLAHEQQRLGQSSTLASLSPDNESPSQ